MKTPAFTTATAWSKAETGVGATMAAGNHLCIGISAALPMPKANIASKYGAYSGLRFPSKTPFLDMSREPVRTQTHIMAGSKKITEDPTSIDM